MAKYPTGTIFYLTTVKTLKKESEHTYQAYMKHKKETGMTWREFKRRRHYVIQQFPIDKK